eukprot:CAMPEP_0119472670 /NCGR_PEP_ID=MMETSP1344-20130328/4631_1 /TAXON_ID=236787 /ORGANISM="Florenciella parvula, Strain CCMP2471" /LENGTH=275 /DNA_ID=CAMNT_0007505649 /DNA_START=1336 /DNA_END=2161 /DNA_ORIENTATION=+
MMKGSKKGTTGKQHGKKGKGAAAEPEIHRCFHCETESTKRMCCSQCHRAWYCGRPCQKKHWKQHKRACVAAVAAEARQGPHTEAQGDGGTGRRWWGRQGDVRDLRRTGGVAGGAAVWARILRGVLAELRTKKVAQACPLCREVLPPGLDGLYDLANRAILRIEGMVGRGEVSWASLPTAEQEEAEEAIAMLTEAGAQGHTAANIVLGYLLSVERMDFDGAVAAYRAAIAVDPGHVDAHNNLGILLHNERNDIDGAEAAYRAAIAADPGHAAAHTN